MYPSINNKYLWRVGYHTIISIYYIIIYLYYTKNDTNIVFIYPN